MPLMNGFSGGGGGGGKMMQQFTLPLSNQYEEFSTGKEWDISEIEGQPYMIHSYYDPDSNMIYAVTSGKENESDTSNKIILYMQDVGSGQVTKEGYPVIESATLYCPFIHSSGLFMFVYRNKSTYSSDSKSETDYEIWDRKSPVNGTLPEAVLADPGITGEQFLMIFTTVIAFYFGTQSEKKEATRK